jgi:hypothetical protein
LRFTDDFQLCSGEGFFKVNWRLCVTVAKARDQLDNSIQLKPSETRRISKA